MFRKSDSDTPSVREKLPATLEGLRVHDHLCLIYETREEQFATIIPFVRIGLERGEKCVYIADDNTAAAVLAAMHGHGIDVDGALESGALSVISKKEAYLREGYFDPDLMIGFLRDAIEEAKKEGFMAIRATGEMTWALGDEIGVERLLEYEAKLNYFIPKNGIIAICQYNRKRFNPEIIRDIIRTHPLVIHGDMVCRNHYFVPPDEFLAKDSVSHEVDRLLLSIREREGAEVALRNALSYNRSLIEASLDPLVTINADGTITDVNSATEKATGYSRRELIGTDFSDYFTQPENARRGYQQVFSEGTVLDYELEIRHRNGEVTPVLYNATVYRNEAGDVGGVFAAARDISERKKLEDQLRHSQKMEAVGLLAGGVAHDFNNLLQAIIGYGHLLLMKMREDDPLKVDVDMMLAAADKAAGVTQSLLAFSRKQVMNPHPINLNERIAHMEKFLARVIGEEIRISTVFREEPLYVNVDSVQIEQVLMNLATNARDAMPRGGILSIATESVEMDAHFIKVHGYGAPGWYARISLNDTGTGMDAATAKRVFEPFFTTKEFGKGSGLGLAIVYGIVRQHNGYIDLDSEPGKGTTFRIYLPLLKAVSAVAEPFAGPSRPERGTETILIAEDDHQARILLKEILTAFGYAVIEATDGEDALAKFMDNRDRIQLMLLDMIMPKKRGNEVYDEIRKMGSPVKAVFLSGYPSDVVQGNQLLEQGLDLIMKPVSPRNLLVKLREVLDGK
jgi:PAS domain S-box-containing protein